MVPLFFCAIICQNFDFWEDGFQIGGCWEVPNAKVVYKIHAMDGVKPERGYTVTTWGATEQCRRLTVNDHQKFLAYLVSFDGDGGSCL